MHLVMSDFAFLRDVVCNKNKNNNNKQTTKKKKKTVTGIVLDATVSIGPSLCSVTWRVSVAGTEGWLSQLIYVCLFVVK